jgi:16S rRNA (guanine(966)-N(2))-methyltransferase RsmD
MRLFAAKGLRLRPTSDRLRESIFNILFQKVDGTAVLDLFAGTGAMGIEALSRGAVSATFVDNHYQSIKVIRKNLETCRLTSQSAVIRWDATRNLNCLTGLRFDLAFLDPPYNRQMLAPALDALYRSQCMVPHAVVIVEHSGLVSFPQCCCLLDQRKYGKTVVSFLNFR